MWFALKDKLLQVENEYARLIQVGHSDTGHFVSIGPDDVNSVKITCDSQEEAMAVFNEICENISKNRKFIDLRKVTNNGGSL